MRETVGDIDIIAASNEPKKLIETFVTTDGVTQVLASGDTKAMVMYGGHIDLDLEILPPAEYGSLLQHFSGSKEHNIAMRTLTEDLGLSFSEHGFKVTKPNHPWAKKQVALAKKAHRFDAKQQMILCAKEEEVYATIGLAWIPPELRENSGELAAAKAGTLPKLVELTDIKGDIHNHSNRSGDGREEPATIVERAIELGYQYIGITDHTQGLGVAGKLSNRQFARYLKELHTLNERYNEIRVLAGCELNIMADGTLDVPDSLLAEMDVVVASVHSAFRQNQQVMTDRILKALDNPHIDIIAHPSTRILGYREEIDVDWDQIFARAAATQTALEINAYPERLDLDGVRIRRAKELGCRFVISTDTHQLAHLDNLRFGVAMARRGWCEKDQILNIRPLKQFLAWLNRSV
jgi:DNA polymerase (family 10)